MPLHGPKSFHALQDSQALGLSTLKRRERRAPSYFLNPRHVLSRFGPHGGQRTAGRKRSRRKLSELRLAAVGDFPSYVVTR